MVWQWRGTNSSSNHTMYSVCSYNGVYFNCLQLLCVLWYVVLFQRTMVLKILKENLVMVTPLRWSNFKQWFKNGNTRHFFSTTFIYDFRMGFGSTFINNTSPCCCFFPTTSKSKWLQSMPVLQRAYKKGCDSL